MKTILYLATAMVLSTAPLNAEPPATYPIHKTDRVAFAQYCFWSGEMELGQIEGVVRTEAGYFRGREVTLVDYDSSKLSLEQLTAQARRAGVADTIHLTAGAQSATSNIAGVTVGVALDGTYRTAPASDQKKQIEGTPYSRLKLTPEQATKVNAFARVNPDKASEYLTPAQRTTLATAR